MKSQMTAKEYQRQTLNLEADLFCQKVNLTMETVMTFNKGHHCSVCFFLIHKEKVERLQYLLRHIDFGKIPYKKIHKILFNSYRNIHVIVSDSDEASVFGKLWDTFDDFMICSGRFIERNYKKSVDPNFSALCTGVGDDIVEIPSLTLDIGKYYTLTGYASNGFNLLDITVGNITDSSILHDCDIFISAIPDMADYYLYRYDTDHVSRIRMENEIYVCPKCGMKSMWVKKDASVLQKLVCKLAKKAKGENE